MEYNYKYHIIVIELKTSMERNKNIYPGKSKVK